VVNPTVGLPLFLGSVALTSLAVHAAVLTNTTWFGTYWQGAKGKTAMETTTPRATPAASTANSAFSITVTPVAATDANKPASFVVTVTPNAAAPTTVEPAVSDSKDDSGGVHPVRSASAQ
jgi:light-harvesting protein B-800-850 alpha chain